MLRDVYWNIGKAIEILQSLCTHDNVHLVPYDAGEKEMLVCKNCGKENYDIKDIVEFKNKLT